MKYQSNKRSTKTVQVLSSQPDTDRADYQTKYFEDGLYWSYGGIEWHLCAPQPFKSTQSKVHCTSCGQPIKQKPPISERPSTTSISNSQELDKILKLIWEATWIEGKVNVPEAKAQLLQLALSCLPKKKYPIGVIVGTQNNKASFNQGQNAAIDTIEQNIKERFS